MKIKKFAVLVICLAGLFLSLLPVSFAKDSLSPITSPMPEPVPSIVSGSEYDTVTLYYVVQWNASFAGSNSRYYLFEMICRIPHGASAVLNINRQQTALFFSGDRLPPLTVNIYDLLTGTLVESSTNANFASYGTVNGYSSSYGFRSGYFPENNAFSDICAGGFAIVPSGISITGGESVYNSSPFVTWSQQPLEHNLYHSHLSEPSCDQYNRYFIIDDRLYWLSIQLNGFYIEKSFVENSSVVVPDYEFAGDETVHDDSNGSYSHVWVEFNGKQFIPVSLTSGQFSNSLPFYLTLIPSDSVIRLVLEPYSFLNSPNNSSYPYYLQSSFFLSEFNLEDGTYVSSSFTEVNSSISLNHYLNFTIEPGSSVHCYGINWFNNLNLPYNLSDVLWEYDLDFVLWRDDMLQRLTDIYNLLSEAESVSSYQAPDLASKMDDENIINDLSYNSGDVQQDLNEHIDRGISALGSDGGVLQSLSSQIIGLGNGKIFSLLIISLSLGILILILGKNKND